ncbi:MAG: sigma-70 family RNA polymerase sigma factor [Clostridia bacterium]|nr:sigma-70 family RNA polymerase sigma factor [Clostridia bacterium]
MTDTVSSVVEENMGLVYACTKRYVGKGIEYDDLVQAGCEGLIKASKGFDPSRNVRFSTYAVPVILGELRAMFRKSGTVSVSRSVKELGIKAQKLSDEIYSQKGIRPKISELADALSTSCEELAEALCAAQQPLSIDSEEWHDTPAPGFEHSLTENVALRQAVYSLDSKSRSVIMLRYFGGLTQKVTAQRLGMTQVQVSRTESRAMKQLRVKLEP